MILLSLHIVLMKVLTCYILIDLLPMFMKLTMYGRIFAGERFLTRISYCHVLRVVRFITRKENVLISARLGKVFFSDVMKAEKIPDGRPSDQYVVVGSRRRKHKLTEPNEVKLEETDVQFKVSTPKGPQDNAPVDQSGTIL